MKGPRRVYCRICGTPLTRKLVGWQCPVSGLWFQVWRGKVLGKPLLKPPGGEEQPQPEQPEYDESVHEAFMRYMQAAGWTEEQWNRLSEDARKTLFERWKERAGF